MLDSSNPPVAPIAMGSATDSSVIAAAAVGHQPAPVGISQTVLQWHQWPQAERLQASSSPQAQLAMAELIAIIQRLKSPLGGWPRNIPPTPANLTLYVLDEASAVIDGLLENQPSTPLLTEDHANLPLDAIGVRPYTVLADWSPQLLWGIARSSYLVMQLLGGIRVTVASTDAPADANPESGVLRLRAILTGESEQWSAMVPPDVAVEQAVVAESGIAWMVDLVTCTTPGPALSGDVTVNWYQSGQAIHDQSGTLLEMLRQTIAETTPELAALMQGVAADWLQPGQAWQSGRLRLTVDLEFISDAALAAGQLAQLTELADVASRLVTLQQSEGIAPDPGVDAITLGDWLDDDSIDNVHSPPASPAEDGSLINPAPDVTPPVNGSDHGELSDTAPSQLSATPEAIAPGLGSVMPSGQLKTSLSDLHSDRVFSPDLSFGTDMEVMTAMDNLDDETPTEIAQPTSDLPTGSGASVANLPRHDSPINALQELMAQELMAMVEKTSEPMASISVDDGSLTADSPLSELSDSTAEPLTLDHLFTDLPPLPRAEDVLPAPPESFPEIRLTPRVFAPDPQPTTPVSVSSDLAVLAAPSLESGDFADLEELNLSALFSVEPGTINTTTTQVDVVELDNTQVSGATEPNSHWRSLPTHQSPLYGQLAIRPDSLPSDSSEADTETLTVDGLFADLPPLDEVATTPILIPPVIQPITAPLTTELPAVVEPTAAPVSDPFPLDHLPLQQIPTDWLAAEMLLQTATTEQSLDLQENPLLQLPNPPSSSTGSPLILPMHQSTEPPEHQPGSLSADCPEESCSPTPPMPPELDLAAAGMDAESTDAIATVTPLVMPPMVFDSPPHKTKTIVTETPITEAIEVEAMVLPSPLMPPISTELQLPAVLRSTLASCVGKLHNELHQQWAIVHHLHSLLPEIQAILSTESRQQSVNQETNVPHDRLIPLVVTAACAIIDTLEAPSDRHYRSLIPQSTSASSDELLHQLLWHLTRNCYLMTEFIGGVKAEVLQPGQGWTSGTLRLLALLQTRNWLPVWHIDLATGEVCEVPPPAVTADAIAHLSHHLLPNPCSVAQIKQTLLQRLDRLTPGLRSLLDGIPLQLSQEEPAAIAAETIDTGDDAASNGETIPTLRLILDLTFAADCHDS